MRIQELRFKNLNSLVGEWHIDLTHPAYAADGIFAITGPTGAGKTTILDAICLALYGRTPRLNKVSKNGNEIMSRLTGECFAEVTFATASGRYRCHWSQRRARKRPDGKLQAPKHEIADAHSGQIIESGIRGVAERIEWATGMDFDRFTRSMLLAQGGFAAFLQAAPDERAPILEQITGTEIYSQISIRVHERQREERAKLDLLQAETAGIVILEPEQEQEIKQTLQTKQQEETNLAAQWVEIGKAMTWLTTVQGLQKEIASLTDEARQLQAQMEAFTSDRTKLERALHAASLDGTYATLTATRKQQVEDQSAWKIADAALPALQATVQEQAEALKLAEQQSAQVKKRRELAAPVWQQVRALDQKLADRQRLVLEEEAGCKKDKAKIDADIKARLLEEGKRSQAQTALDALCIYLENHAEDEWLIGGLAGVEEQFAVLFSQRQEIVAKKTALEAAHKNLERAAKSLQAAQQQTRLRQQMLENAAKALCQGKEDLRQLLGDRLLREVRAEKDALLREMAYLTRIAELEAYRPTLEDGKPCPLCGATEHPYAAGNVPIPDAMEKQIEALTSLIRQAEDQETAIEKRVEAENLARHNLSEAEKQESAAAHEQMTAEQALTEREDALVKLHADFAQRRQAVTAKLQPLGITDIPETDIPSLLESLRARLQAWQTRVQRKAVLEKQIADIGSEMGRLDAVIENQNAALTEKQERLETLKKERATIDEERKALYGDQHPDEEERRLTRAIADAEAAEKQAREQHNALQQNWNTAKAHVESLKKRIDQREPERIRLENEFAAALAPFGFLNEEQFLAAMLPSATRAELTAMAKDLDERQTDLKARQKDRETRLATEMARKITDRSLEELEPQFKEQEEALKELRDIIAGLKHQLSENAAAKERIKEKQTAIEAQKKECCRWDNLHELIGSADGKKYRNFAQGLTFEMMVGHANRQLQKMSDRYLLVRDHAQPLELNVVDSYQGGEVRSTKNLSGGEGFIVSLSLALGLSQMASKNVRVDSLFLDEGFGTLDEEALDTALETLAGLQQDGKLIGVISHVPALKERISTQILVAPQTGGRSQISGPGCQKLVPTDAGQ